MPEKKSNGKSYDLKASRLRTFLSRAIQFETCCVSNLTVCRFAEKARFFRSLRTGRSRAAASPSAFFNGKTLYSCPGVRDQEDSSPIS